MNDAEQPWPHGTLFSALNAAEQERWLEQGIRRTYAAGQIFVPRGTVWPYLFLVQSGKVQAEKESLEGRRLQVLTVNPGEVFWGTAFFLEDSRMPVSLEAVVESSLYLWPRERLLPLLLENSKALWHLSQVMVSRMTRASEIVEDLAFQPVAGRLARLLLERYGVTGSASMERDLTLDDMAARIGSTREMVCRALYRFSDDDLIQITRTEFTINKPSALAQLAGLPTPGAEESPGKRDSP
ncbi:MAG: Crp/Fnr family transcriptional regulator [Anaerolineae bacterium]|nr:Crp/Fnr family transcriptional regulator [Anaerolineae bacterium]